MAGESNIADIFRGPMPPEQQFAMNANDPLNNTAGMTTARPQLDAGGAAGPMPPRSYSIPRDYYEKVPQERRLSRTGTSHPGYRWEVFDPKTGTVMGKPYTNSSRATGRADKLDNDFGAYRYKTRPIRASDMTDDELNLLRSLGIELPP